jgi:hypothetical protein
MGAARLLWPRRLSDLPGFPAELVGPLAAHRITTVADLVARVKLGNPGLVPPRYALGLHVWTHSCTTDREAARVAAAVLADYLGYRDHERPADWTDPPKHLQPREAAPMPTKYRQLPTESLTLHPEASRVPEMPEDQYARFLSDVCARGIEKPIELLPGTRVVIDGRTRLKAAKDAGFASVPVVEAVLGGQDPVVYMIRVALHRRQMTKSQAAALAVEVEAVLAISAKDRQSEGGRKGGSNRGKSALAKLPEPSASRGGSFVARDKAGEEFRVSGRYVSDAKKVKKADPALFEKVKAGEVTLQAANRILKPEPTLPAKPARKPDLAPICALHDLRECPFCGANEGFLRYDFSRIVCNVCLAQGPTAANETKARAEWNKRAKK